MIASRLVTARAVWIVAAALGAGYAVPLYDPPSGPVSAGWTPLAAAFPEVPEAWIAGRLAALVGVALWLGMRLPLPVWQSGMGEEHEAERPPLLWLAVAVSLLHVASLPWAQALPAWGQAAYVLALFAPAALLGVGTRCAPCVGAQVAWRTVVGVCCAWLALRWLCGDPRRAADVVDMWRPFETLARMASKGGNYLIEAPGRQLPGVSSLPFFFEGLPLLQLFGWEPTLAWLQAVHTWMLFATVLLLASVIGALLSTESAVVAATAYLFSPFALLAQTTPIVMAIGPLYAAATVFVAFRVVRTRSAAWVALLGSVAGLAASNPSLVPFTGALLVAVGVAVWRAGQRPSLAVLVVATACFVAAIGPSLPTPTALRAMVELYSAPSWPWATVEASLNGQIAPLPADWAYAVGSPWAAPLGALLVPFAAARNGLRLHADALFEPWSAVLVAIGIVVALRARREALLLPLALWLALAPALVSNVDRPSVVRWFGGPVPFVLLVAWGFEALRLGLATARWRRIATVVTCIVIGTSGTLLFDGIWPRVLPQSAHGMALRAAGEGALPHWLTARTLRPERAWLGREIDPLRRHYRADWLRSFHPYSESILPIVAARPWPVAWLEDIEAAADPVCSNRNDPEVVVWSPALDDTAGVTARLCTVWPDAAVLRLFDVAGRSELRAAVRPGASWRPVSGRWSMFSCREAPREMPGSGGTQSFEIEDFAAQHGVEVAGVPHLVHRDVVGEVQVVPVDLAVEPPL